MVLPRIVLLLGSADSRGVDLSESMVALCLLAWIVLAVCLPLDETASFFHFKWLFPFMLLGYGVAHRGGLSLPAQVKTPTALPVTLALFVVLTVVTYSPLHYEMWSRFAYTSISDIVQGLGMYAVSCLGILVWFLVAGHLVKSTRLGHGLSFVGQHTAVIYASHMFLVRFVPAVSSGIIGYGFGAVCSCVIILACALAQAPLNRLKVYRMMFGRFWNQLLGPSA